MLRSKTNDQRLIYGRGGDAACAALIYTSQHKRNITQVLMTEKKIFVLWGREEDLLRSPPFHAGQGWISSLAMCAEAQFWQSTRLQSCANTAGQSHAAEEAEDGQEGEAGHCSEASEWFCLGCTNPACSTTPHRSSHFIKTRSRDSFQ